MRAVLRLGLAVAAAGFWLGPSPALAQSTAQATTNTPATDAIGPRELQNFSLPGTVTRPAAQPGGQASAASAPRTSDVADAVSASPTSQPTARQARSARTAQAKPETAVSGNEPGAPPPVTLPVAEAATSAPASLPAMPSEAPATLAPQQSVPIWPWLLAALALGVGGAFLYRRRSSREAYAGGPQIDEFVAPEPQPHPPIPPAAPPSPNPAGFVSSRMRPWIDIGFQPMRCILGEQGVTFEFELELFNSGNAAARDVLIEASVINAGPTQDQEIRAFFANSGQGQRIAAVTPLQRVSLRPQFALPIEQVRVLEAGGRKVFVPLIAFKAIYGWGGGAGQTAAAYLLGRDTKGEKLAPFRVDLGPRVFRGLGARALPLSVRN